MKNIIGITCYFDKPQNVELNVKWLSANALFQAIYDDAPQAWQTRQYLVLVSAVLSKTKLFLIKRHFNRIPFVIFEKFYAMRFFALLLFFILILSCQTTSVVSKHVKGQVIRHKNFSSKYVKERHVDVWLPKNYSKNKKYAVIYMHDGQMLFDSTKTWNKQAWDVDKTASDLMKHDLTRSFVVVGIWNIPENRHADYFPQKPYDYLTADQKNKINLELRSKGRINDVFQPNSDNYLKFIVEELKPFIEKNYAVSVKKNDIYLIGSSMGGLISMYGVMEYPDVFGGAGCMSTHWIGTWQDDDNPIPMAFTHYINQKLSTLKQNKFYFDYGDQTLDELYTKHQTRIDYIFERNYNHRLWQTLYFPGQDHSENAWKKRLNAPLTFLLKQYTL